MAPARRRSLALLALLAAGCGAPVEAPDQGGRFNLVGCHDACPSPVGGLPWGCERRFAYGANWAWYHFGGDFGGVARWGWGGAALSHETLASQLGELRAAGANVVRWWMFPRLFSDGIVFGADDAPSGIGGTLVDDLAAALALADANDVYLVLTPFSFDDFTPTRAEAGQLARGLRPMVVDAARRKELLDNLIAPVARAVESSPYRHRVLAWDMINEPEWAIAGASLYGDPDFTPTADLETVSHAEMETFLVELAAVLHANSSALVTVGSAAIKWAHAWSHVALDFRELHYYDWVYEFYPYAKVTLASAGIGDRPVVMGEFPVAGLDAIPAKALPARTLPELVGDLWAGGYAGALAWSFTDGWQAAPVAAFASEHPCEVRY